MNYIKPIRKTKTK